MEASQSIPATPRYKIAEEKMLDAACAVYAAEGFDRANMATIAARAGTTKPTLYSRFGSKEQLFAATVRREYELRKERLFAAYETNGDEPFHLRLSRWNSAFFDFVRERPDGFRLISEGERYPAAAAIIARTNDEIVERIADLVMRVSRREGRPSARLVAAMIAGMLTSCAREAVGRGRVDLDAAAALSEQVLYTAMRGLDRELMDAVDAATREKGGRRLSVEPRTPPPDRS
jgi:AcrR family transcriptional regulator